MWEQLTGKFPPTQRGRVGAESPGREEPTQAPGVLGHIQDAVQHPVCREPWHPRRYLLFLRSCVCRHHGRGPTQLPGEETSDPGVDAMLAIYWSHDQRLPSATGSWWKAAGSTALVMGCPPPASGHCLA